MRILFIRHGHPDYVKNCLTELGREQAKKAAQRLKDEGISEIFSSPFGRAVETASYTAELLSKTIVSLDFMREIKWGSLDDGELYQSGHPWHLAQHVVSLGYSLMDEAWTKEEAFSKNVVYDEIERVADSADAWLETIGYKREGANYRVIGECTDKTVAIFSHGGSSTAFLSHILNIPFFYLCNALSPDFTAVTAIKFSDEKGTLTAPKIEYANDAKHICGGEATYQM